MREVVNMASIPEKKAILNLSDGASVNLNKPIDIPNSITDISSITDSHHPNKRFYNLHRWKII